MAQHRNVNACQLVHRPAKFITLRRLVFGSSEWTIFSGIFDPGPADLKRNVEPDAGASVLLDQFAIRGFDPRAAAERDDARFARVKQVAQSLRFDAAERAFAVFVDQLRRSSS